MSTLLDIDFICLRAERPGKRIMLVMTAESDFIARYTLGLILKGYVVSRTTTDEYDAFVSDHHYRTATGKASVVRYKIACDDPSLDNSIPSPGDDEP